MAIGVGLGFPMVDARFRCWAKAAARAYEGGRGRWCEIEGLVLLQPACFRLAPPRSQSLPTA